MKIAVLLSGGVDSSVALGLLAKGYPGSLTAYYLKIWLEDDLSYLGSCPWEEDLSFAGLVCEALGVPLHSVPLQTEYYQRVVSYTLEELKRGNTPSPDIFCNQRVKFGAFFEAVDQGFDKVATGHYARLAWLPGATGRRTFDESHLEDGLDALDPQAGQGEGRWALFLAPDPVKDQSYFLSHLDQTQLSRICFPVGGLLKSAVRQLATELHLATEARPDSQGICFLGKIKYPDFVRFYLGEQEGNIVRADTGEVLGRHKGTWFHTPGQRTGLGLGNGPWYVSAKDLGRNVVYVNHASHIQDQLVSRVLLADFHWIAGRAPDSPEILAMNQRGRLSAKLRHGPSRTPCHLEEAGGQWVLHLAQPDAGVAAGQFGVLYQGEECLGSGTIAPLDSRQLDELWQRHRDWQEAHPPSRASLKKARRRGLKAGGPDES